MKKWNAKQWGLIVGSLLIAFILQYVMWILIMGHPDEIDAMYHVLTTVCLAGAFVLVGDKFLKANLYK
jgi:cytochrome bd-type quinol oxidase subunit 2